MATTTYEPIATQTLGSAAATIDFSSISQAYTDLVVVFKGSNSGTTQYFLQVGNGSIDTGTNYSTTVLDGNGSAAASGRYSNSDTGVLADYYGTSGGNVKQTIFNLQNYSNTTTYKTILLRSSLPASETVASVGLWRSTSAINTIRLRCTSGNFEAGSIVTIYGIANADIGAKATGGVITYDDTYYYHTFGASGTFTPKQSLTCDVLMVAGGAGTYSGSGASGGSGAGGLLYGSIAFTAAAHTVTVGAGGPGSTSTNSRPSSGGSDTVISGGSITTATALGGGFGARNGDDGIAGGCGGGAGGYVGNGSNRSNTAATQGNSGGLTGYGFTGGTTTPINVGAYGGSGGGGTGGVGADCANTSTGAGPAGGIGRQYLAFANATGTGDNGYYGGGGGGGLETSGAQGAGGLGGGGKGATNNLPATAGKVNTGGGAGGSTGNYVSLNTNGGSGIVIVRYPK